MSDGYIYEAVDQVDGIPMWACYRKEGGICGYGPTMKDALNDYLDKTEELVPEPKPSYVVHSSPFEPPTYGDNPGFREDEP